MPRVCTICTHPARATIDDGLVTGQSLRAISAAYGLSKSAVDRHKDSHLPPSIRSEPISSVSFRRRGRPITGSIRRFAGTPAL
jgi:hypothetical protein